ncbi:MAG TPA: hypothetical protein VIO38_04000, partial [Rariglobus sp.]
MFSASVFPARVRSEPALLITATPYAGKTQSWAQALIFRELVRQAVFIAASQDADRWAADEAFDGYNEPGAAARPRVRVDTQLKDGRLTATVQREASAASPPYTLDVAAGGRDDQQVEAAARGLAPLMRTGLPAWLKENLPATPPPRVTGLLAAKRLAQLEKEPSPYAAFELLRHWHARARTAGAAPEVLAGLARSYAVLGESSRHAWNAFPMACDARALLYLAWLEDAHPQHPLAAETRAWVRGLTGYHALAAAALDELAK